MALIFVTGCVSEAHHQHAHQKPRTALTALKLNAGLLAAESAPVCLYANSPSVKVDAAAAIETVGSNRADVQRASASPETITALEHAQRRERERDCYRDAEARVRRKLTQLQAFVRSSEQATVPVWKAEMR